MGNVIPFQPRPGPSVDEIAIAKSQRETLARKRAALEIEIAFCEAQHNAGVIPAETPDAIFHHPV